MLHTIFLIMSICNPTGTQCDFEAVASFEGVDKKEVIQECLREVNTYPLSVDADCYSLNENNEDVVVYESVVSDALLIFEK